MVKFDLVMQGCPIVRDFRASFPGFLQRTEEWNVRISQFSEGWHHRWPRTWSWRFKLEASALALDTYFDLPSDIEADVVDARSLDEND